MFTMDNDAGSVLVEYINELTCSVIEEAALLARHRKSKEIDASDVNFILGKKLTNKVKTKRMYYFLLLYSYLIIQFIYFLISIYIDIMLSLPLIITIYYIRYTMLLVKKLGISCNMPGVHRPKLLTKHSFRLAGRADDEDETSSVGSHKSSNSLSSRT